MIPRDVMGDVLADLALTFGTPYGTDDAATHRLVDRWCDALDDCDPGEVRQAAREYLRTGRKFPVPADLRDRALALRRRRLELERAQQREEARDLYCLRCGATTLITLVNGRLRPLHREDCPGLHPEDLLAQRAALAQLATEAPNHSGIAVPSAMLSAMPIGIPSTLPSTQYREPISADAANPVPHGVTRCAYHYDCDVAERYARREGRTIDHQHEEPSNR